MPYIVSANVKNFLDDDNKFEHRSEAATPEEAKLDFIRKFRCQHTIKDVMWHIEVNLIFQKVYDIACNETHGQPGNLSAIRASKVTSLMIDIFASRNDCENYNSDDRYGFHDYNDFEFMPEDAISDEVYMDMFDICEFFEVGFIN